MERGEDETTLLSCLGSGLRGQRGIGMDGVLIKIMDLGEMEWDGNWRGAVWDSYVPALLFCVCGFGNGIMRCVKLLSKGKKERDYTK